MDPNIQSLLGVLGGLVIGLLVIRLGTRKENHK
jgi:hypothetical protein